MEEIEEVVQEIVAGCKAHKVTVSPLLAAFCARTILEGDSVSFALEKDLSDDDVNKIIEMSIARLLERDSPSLETVKMQVGFDSSHVTAEERVRNRRNRAEEKKRERHRDIISTKRKLCGGKKLKIALSALHTQLPSPTAPGSHSPFSALPQLSTRTTSTP